MDNKLRSLIVDEDTNQVRDSLQKMLQTMNGNGISGLEILDRNTFDIIQRLAQAGILTINNQSKTLSLVHSLRDNANLIHHTQVPILFSDSQEILQHVNVALKKAASE